MEKIIVIGSPGAGKSSFSKKLKNITKLPLYHIDMLYLSLIHISEPTRRS